MSIELKYLYYPIKGVGIDYMALWRCLYIDKFVSKNSRMLNRNRYKISFDKLLWSGECYTYNHHEKICSLPVRDVFDGLDAAIEKLNIFRKEHTKRLYYDQSAIIKDFEYNYNLFKNNLEIVNKLLIKAHDLKIDISIMNV